MNSEAPKVSFGPDFWGFQTYGDAKLETLLAAADRFLRDLEYGVGPYWLSLLGPSGIGKTHLAKRIFRECFTRLRFYCHECGATLSAMPMWIDWRKASDRMKEGEFGWIDDVCDAWFVAIDDVGAEHDPSKMAASKLDRILNSRLGKWTVITSNLDLEGIARQLDPRIASRMRRLEGVIVESTAEDFATR